jgi:hypothetical protein
MAAPGTLSKLTSARKFIQEFDSFWLSGEVIRLADQFMSRENPAKLIDDKSKMPNVLFILLCILKDQFKKYEKYKNPDAFFHYDICLCYLCLPG